MKSRELLLALRDVLISGLKDYPFPCPDGGGTETAQDGRQPRSGAGAFSGEPEFTSGAARPATASVRTGRADRASSEQNVRVFLHGLPDEHGEETYPFVVIRWIEGRIDEEDPLVMGREIVGLVIGVYAPRNQEQAGLLSAMLMDAVRQILWRNRLLAKMFDLVPPLRGAIPAPEKKWNQYHMATVESEWNYALPPRAMGKEGSQSWKMNLEMRNP